jgi:hypothetical protein
VGLAHVVCGRRQQARLPAARFLGFAPAVIQLLVLAGDLLLATAQFLVGGL